MAYVKKKIVDNTTFYTCVKCGNPLRESEITLSFKSGLLPTETTCNKCLLAAKVKAPPPLKKYDTADFEVNRVTFDFHGQKMLLIEMLDYHFTPYYEIQDSNGVVIYLTGLEQSPEGIEAYEHLIQTKVIVLPTAKNH